MFKNKNKLRFTCVYGKANQIKKKKRRGKSFKYFSDILHILSRPVVAIGENISVYLQDFIILFYFNKYNFFVCSTTCWLCSHGFNKFDFFEEIPGNILQ